MLMQQLASRENVTRAFENALTERFTDEHAMFQSENTHAKANKNEIIDSLIEELKNQASYQPRLGFYYEVPKSPLVDRPVVYLPFEELVVHYAFIQVIADVLDPQLLGCCFANRLNRRPKEKRLSQSLQTLGGQGTTSGRKRVLKTTQ
ncbi:hypothetical protein [Vibrio agarivorans]|uniref:hypothetical protein n=1 Tax=Vibrio agarivorans TaxID=153622 RepID=UPI0025B3F16E|nr:hypothetical protein [Vibrio agarivorans]MDN3663368.1 hypothetical protein [Vibrio agarivorans]